MEPWNQLALDQPQLKSYLAVMMKERRQDSWEDLRRVSDRCGVPEETLARLESNQFQPDLDTALVKAVAQGYRISFQQMGDMVRVACISSLVNVMRSLDDAANE